MRKLIGSVESAAIFGVSQATFNRWVAAGRIEPAVNMEGVTGARLYSKALIERLARKHRRSPDSWWQTPTDGTDAA